MKTRILIIIGCIVTLGFTGIALAEPIPIPEPPYFENIDKEKPCGEGTTYQDGICIANQTENSNQTKNLNDKWPAAYQNDKLENPYQTQNPNECWYQDKDGQMVPCVMEHTIDLDPDLSPSYSYDWPGSTFYLNFYPLVIVPLVVAGLFLIPHFILKRKNIPSKPYMALILSGLLLHYGISSLISNVIHLSSRLFLIDKGVSNFIAPLYVSFLIPIIVLGIAGILLYRSSIIRKLIKR